MNPHLLLSALVLPVIAAASDSVVVFNEVNYNPPTDGEWIELQNQLSVDVDVSGWSLAGGVSHTFPEGTVISAGGYLLVRDAAATLPGALGPWTGRLDNAGETLALRDNNGRVMDELAYRPDGDWPVAADGAGPTLARRTRHLPTGDAASWTASRQAGGTPGAENFPSTLPPVETPLVAWDAAWKTWTTGTDPGAAWREATFDDTAWTEGAGGFAHGAALPDGVAAGSALPAGPAAHFFRRAFTFAGQAAHTTLRLRLVVDDGAAVFLNGTELVRVNLAADAAFDAPAVQPRRGAPRVQEFSVPGHLLVAGTNMLAVEVHQAMSLPSYAAAVVASGPVAYWRLGESASPLGDLADAPAAPEQGPQDGTFAGIAPANVAQPGPRPTDTVGGQPLSGFDAGNTAPFFQGNGDGGNDVALFPDPDGAMNFGPGRKFSFEAWVKAPPSGHDEGGPVLAKGTGGGGEQFACDFVGGRYRFYVWDGGNPNTPVVAQSTVAPNNTWQHVVGVYDQSQGLMRLYVNGVQASSATPRPTLVSNTHEVSVGARKGSAGAAYDLNMLGVVDEVALYARALTQAEVTAHYTAAFTAGVPTLDTADAAFALALDAVETLPAGSTPVVRFNEVAGALEGAAFAVEVTNASAGAVDLGSWTLARLTVAGRTDVSLPAGNLPVGGYAVIDAAALGFEPLDGDRLVLFAPDGTAVDGLVVKKNARARHPDATGEWMRPTAATFGAANAVTLQDAVVISEIMHHPPSPPLAASAVSGQWVELHNKSAAPVDLSGWELAGDADYALPAGTMLPAGGFLVIAQNPALLPGVNALGPWSGKLGRGEGRVALRDAVGNPADEVRYFSGGHWPEASDGGGSSLELTDPRADNADPQAWAGSDESGTGEWQTFTWRGPANAGISGEPTQWREIDLCLVDGAGECLVDDVRVTDTVTNQELIQNGTFSAGMAKWRATGTHRQTRVETEAGNAGNQVLRVIATGAGEYQGNQVESTFLNNTALVTGREYEISLRARWLSGGGKLNVRLYFNRIARTHQLAVNPRGGTPGAPNSRAVANLGPSVRHLAHSPAVPAAGQGITISADVADADGLGAVALKWSVNGGAWQTAPMTVSGGRATATLPGQAASATVQFYVEATDGVGAVTQHPPGGPTSRALCRVDDGQAAGGPPHKFRLIMTAADASFMHADANVLSNAFLGATVIGDEQDIHYDAGVRLKGSFVGRNVPRVGFNVRFQPNRLFRGVHSRLAVDRSQHVAIAQGEIIAKHIASKAGGIPNMYDDLARFIHVLPGYNSSCQLRLTGFEKEYLDSTWPDGGDGRMYELESLRFSSSTADGTVDGTKLPGQGYANPELQDRGDDKEAYRWNWLLSNQRDEDDFGPAMSVAKLFSMTGTAFDTAAKTRLDVDQWLRAMAYQTLVGPGDAIYTGGNIHNIRFYARPHDGRMLYMPWDWDSVWQRGTTASLVAGGNVARVVTVTAHNQRQYLCHVHDIVTTTFNTAYMSRWTQHYGAVAGEDYGSILSYIGARASYALSQLPTGTAWTCVPGTPDANGAVVLQGNANIRVAFIEVNGLAYEPTWASTTSWRITVPLALGQNSLAIRGLDKHGVAVAGAVSDLTVNNSNPPAWPTIRINEWMAENDGSVLDPADGKSDDWLELHNATASPVSLAGWSLSDDPALPRKFILPAGTSLPAGGFLLVWADDEPVQGTPAAPHANFKLSNAGETLGLYAPDGRLVDEVTFSTQRADRTEGRPVDGEEGVRVLTVPTPGGANVLLAVTGVQETGGSVQMDFTTTPGRRYRVEHSADLVTWLPLTGETVASGRSMQATDPAPVNPRFYRAVLLLE